MAQSLHFIDNSVTFPKGFKAAGIKAGIKASGNKDLAMVVSDAPAYAMGVFTQNKAKAAPVLYCQEVLAKTSSVRGIIINSGNANACTGEEGMLRARKMAALSEDLLAAENSSMLIASTGVIGHPLPIDKIEAAIGNLGKALSENGGIDFSEAICTTDTVPKRCALEVSTSRGVVRMGGACKGAGMIHPNMATMLAFVTTDLGVDEEFVPEFKKLARSSFNAITIDGDTSTNDSCFLLANGASGVWWKDLSGQDKKLVFEGLEMLMQELAKKIVRDGEGATKFIEIRVSGAVSLEDAFKAGKAIANSPLVKTAFFGADPNWGRIAAAAGYSGAEMNINDMTIAYNGEALFKKGAPVTGIHDKLRAIALEKEIIVDVNLAVGDAAATVWTCDFSYDYVKINAEYTT